MGMTQSKASCIAGAVAVALNVIAACTWAFWSTCEAFHEGWIASSLLGNILMTLAYLLPCIATVLLGVCAVLRPRWIGVACIALGLALVAWWTYACWPIRPFFFTNILTEAAYVLVLLGILYRIASFPRRKLPILLLICVPALVSIACAIEPISRLRTRVDDGILTERTIVGNGVTLKWAPRGPGWPENGCTWNQAVDACRRLSADGLTLEEKPVDIWRLPTIDEAVRSMTRAGENAAGILDQNTMKQAYARNPDKESPLWQPKSKIIYLWTATEAANDRAYFIAANGFVRTRPKTLAMGSHSFRAVRTSVPATDDEPH